MFLLAHLTLLLQDEEVLLESRRSSHLEASSSAQAAAGDEPQTGLLALEAALEHVVEAGIDAGMDILDAGKHTSTQDCGSLTHSLIRSPTHPPTHPLARSLTHSLTRVMCTQQAGIENKTSCILKASTAFVADMLFYDIHHDQYKVRPHLHAAMSGLLHHRLSNSFLWLHGQ